MHLRTNAPWRTLTIVSAATLLAGLGIAVANAAESGPSTEELLRDCNVRTDLCTFTITSAEDMLGPLHQVSDAEFNCSPDNQTYEKDWATTTTSSVNVGVEINAEVGFAAVFKTSFKATAGYEWSTAKTVTDKAPITVRSGWVGWIDRADSLTQVTGNYELHYGSRKAGHYYWFANGVRFTGPTQDARGNLIAQARPMTDQERSAYCVNTSSASTSVRRSVKVATRMDPSSAVESTPIG